MTNSNIYVGVKKFMKLNFLLAAIIFSSVIFSECKKPETTTAAPIIKDASGAAQASIANARVVFINIDTLQEKYTWFKEQQTIFENRKKTLSSALEAKGRELQNEMTALQEKAQKGLVPQVQLQQEGQNLQRKEQAAIADRDKKSKDLLDETQKFNESLQKRIHDVLSTLETQKGYDYVVSYSKAGGSNFLFVNDKFDITNDVLAILNEKK